MERLEELTKKVDKFVNDRDWDQFHSPENLAKSISIEAAELLECFQWDSNADIEHVKEELADVFIYCIQMASKLDLDLIDISYEKIKKNEEKYPIEKAIGSSKKYTEL